MIKEKLFQINKLVNIKFNMRSFLRIITFSFQNIFRNFSLSIMTIMILILMLLSVNTMILIGVTTDKATSIIKEQIDVSMYFNHKATPEQVEELKQYIVAFPEVTTSTFLNAEEALAQFKETYGGNDKIMGALTEIGENPLGPVIVVKTREPSDYKKIIEALSVPEYKDIIEARTFEDTELAIDKIDTVIQKVEAFSIGLSIFFGIIAFIIIFNTIRVAIYTQRTESSIKKLVGATNWFIRAPYLVSALTYSIIACVVSLGIVWIAVTYIDPQLSGIFQQANFLTSFINSSIIILFLTQFGMVLLLTGISSMLAMGRYLRV